MCGVGGTLMVWHACSIYKEAKRERDEEDRIMRNLRDYERESLDSDNFFEMEGKPLNWYQ